MKKSKVDSNGNTIAGSEKKTTFGINRHYQKSNPAIDYEGKLAQGMPNEKIAFAGMSEQDVQNLKKQYKENPKDIQNSEFESNVDKAMFTSWGSYLKNQGRAILNVEQQYEGLSPEEIAEIKRRRLEGTD